MEILGSILGALLGYYLFIYIEECKYKKREGRDRPFREYTLSRLRSGDWSVTFTPIVLSNTEISKLDETEEQ